MNRFASRAAALLLSGLFWNPVSEAFAEEQVHSETIEYQDAGATFEGFVARPVAGKSGKAEQTAGILMLHDWKGLTDKTREKAKAMAGLGYVVFAMDAFGKGIRPTEAAEAKKNAMTYYMDRGLFRKRVEAGFRELKKQSGVDSKRLAAVGYCFGGTGVLELARTGAADLDGVISFHGSLDSTNKEDGKNIHAKVLALHGADDPNVPAEKIAAFEEEMRFGKVDWQLMKYGGAVHSFTDKSAGNDPSKGSAYHADADRRSWAEAQRFLAEIFGQRPNGVL